MHQVSVGAMGLESWVRFYRTHGSVWTIASFAGLLTGCLQTASVLSEAPSNARLVVLDSGLRQDLSAPALSPVSASPGPSLSPVERDRPQVYFEEYWTALAELNLDVLRGLARSEPEIGFAEGVALLAAGEQEKAESAFLYASRQSTDVNVAVASQIMLATTLLYEHKWTTLRDLTASSRLVLVDRRNTSDLEQWGHAFASVDRQTTSIPLAPVSLPLRVSVVGTPTIRVQINGKEFEFWVDTGSSITVLSSDVAAEANVAILSPDTLTIRTFAGEAPVRPASVKRMELGPIVLTNTPAIVIDASLMRLRGTTEGIPREGLHVDGIIGWDTIRQLDVLIDYENGTIRLARPESLGTKGTTVQNLTWMGKPFVEVRTMLGGTLHFTLDTGAQSSFLNASMLNRTGSITSISDSRVFGIAKTGQRTGRVIPSLALNVAGRTLRLLSVIVYGPAHSGLINSDGVLGSDIAQFGKIRIDATNGLFSVLG
jgi:predicted aspartyl protease